MRVRWRQQQQLQQEQQRHCQLVEVLQQRCNFIFFTVRFSPSFFKAEEMECAVNKIMRVVNVQDNSPGDDAGLEPKVDFVLSSLNIDYFDVDHFAYLM